MENYYKTLDVNENASQDEIKKAFRKLSLKHHPDKGGDSDTFKKINDAYQILGDEQNRKQYDHQRKFGGSMPQGMNGMPEDIFNIFRNMGGGMPGGMPGGFPFVFHEQGNGGFGPNIRIFRNGVEVNQNQMRKPVPIVKSVEITLDEAYSGLKKALEIERWVQEENNMKKVEKETIYVDIPEGIDNNEIIIVRDKGNIINDDLKGDIKIFIKVKEHETYKRNGLDLFFSKNITLCEALCGFNFIMKLLDGKQLSINNSDTVVKNNYEKAIPGMGMKRENSKGRLIIRFNVDFPDSLNNDQKKLIKEALDK